MSTPKPQRPQWVIARLGQDFNWWLDETSEDVYWGEGGRSILDPRQVAHVIEKLDECSRYGFRPDQFTRAFDLYSLEADLSEGLVRLVMTEEDPFDGGTQIFALPRIDEEDNGAYYEFLDAVATARIRQLNATHHYARPCTEEEMDEELEALDRDRYFNAENMHAFDEINEILEWSPAEWDEPSSS